MPQVTSKRSRRRQTRSSGQREVSKFAGDAYSLATRAISGVKKIARLINIETKAFTLSFSFTPASTPSIVYLSAVAQSLDQGGRVGNSLRLQRLYWRYIMNSNAAATDDRPVRVMIVRDNECQGATPSADDILVDVSTGITSTLSPVDINNSNRFAVLQDEMHLLGGTTFQTNGSAAMTNNVSHNGHIKYRGTTAAVASAAEGALFFLCTTTFASNNPVGQFYFTMWYTDD